MYNWGKRQNNQQPIQENVKRARTDAHESNNGNQATTSRANLQPTSAFNNPSPQLPNADIQKVLGRNTIQDKDSDDDEDDEELFFHVSRIEKEILEMDRSQKANPDTPEISYSQFNVKKPMASTQVNRTNFREPGPTTSAAPQDLPPSQTTQVDSNKENFTVSQLPYQNKILNNKCRALEIQVKRLNEQLRSKKMQSSQEISKHSNEVERMRQRMIDLEKENNELKKNQLIVLSQQSVNDDNFLQTEVDNLREEVKSLMKIKEENEVLKAKLSNVKENAGEPSANVNKQQSNKKVDFLSIALSPSLADHFNPQVKPPKFYAPDFNKVKQLCDHQLELQYTIYEFVPLDQSQKEDFDICWLIFQQLFIIVRDLCECIRNEELRRENEIIKKVDFRSRQAELISIQILNDNQSEAPGKEEDSQMIGLDNQKQEGKIRLIGMMAVLASESRTLSKMIATVNVSTLYTFVNEEIESFTLLDMFSKTIEKYIITSRKFFEYTGITHGLATLGCGISRHYSEFDDYTVIDGVLEKFINRILAITLNSAHVLIKLTEFVNNLAKVKASDRLFTKLCKNYPSENIVISNKYRMLQIPLCGCEFQILFMLIVNAFPKYAAISDMRRLTSRKKKLIDKLHDLTLKSLWNSKSNFM